MLFEGILDDTRTSSARCVVSGDREQRLVLVRVERTTLSPGEGRDCPTTPEMEAMSHSPEFDYYPGAPVKIIVCGVNYSGSVYRCIWQREGTLLYEVQYVNDKGDFALGTFYGNELS